MPPHTRQVVGLAQLLPASEPALLCCLSKMKEPLLSVAGSKGQGQLTPSNDPGTSSPDCLRK